MSDRNQQVLKRRRTISLGGALSLLHKEDEQPEASPALTSHHDTERRRRKPNFSALRDSIQRKFSKRERDPERTPGRSSSFSQNANPIPEEDQPATVDLSSSRNIESSDRSRRESRLSNQPYRRLRVVNGTPSVSSSESRSIMSRAASISSRPGQSVLERAASTKSLPEILQDHESAEVGQLRPSSLVFFGVFDPGEGDQQQETDQTQDPGSSESWQNPRESFSESLQDNSGDGGGPTQDDLDQEQEHSVSGGRDAATQTYESHENGRDVISNHRHEEEESDHPTSSQSQLNPGSNSTRRAKSGRRLIATNPDVYSTRSSLDSLIAVQYVFPTSPQTQPPLSGHDLERQVPTLSPSPLQHDNSSEWRPATPQDEEYRLPSIAAQSNPEHKRSFSFGLWNWLREKCPKRKPLRPILLAHLRWASSLSGSHKVLYSIQAVIWIGIGSYFIYRLKTTSKSVAFDCYDLKAQMLRLNQETASSLGNITDGTLSPSRESDNAHVASAIHIPKRSHATLAEHCFLEPINPAVVLASRFDALLIMAMFCCGAALTTQALLLHLVKRWLSFREPKAKLAMKLGVHMLSMCAACGIIVGFAWALVTGVFEQADST